ncbi:MAG: alpha/beta hydrolase [Nocardiaceae bacterium]|nr:alpha/beta hydrolase [Nocardiaceae bacterium]
MRIPGNPHALLRFVPIPTPVSALGIQSLLRTIFSMPIPTQRTLLETVSELLPSAGDVTVEWTTLGGLRTLVLTPPNAGAGAVYYLHGGAFCVMSPNAYQSFLTWLAKASGMRIYAPEYALAPENPFPAAYDDAVAGAYSILDRVPANQLVVAGDSAGANLALSAARALTRSRHAALAGLILISPWSEPAAPPSGEGDTMLTEKWLNDCADAYLDGANPGDPRVSPIFGDLSGLPKTLIHVADDEILNPQAKETAQALHEAGVDVELVEISSFMHSGHLFSGVLRPAALQTEALGAFIRSVLPQEG